MFCVFFSRQFVTVRPLSNFLAYVSVLFPVLVLQREISVSAFCVKPSSILLFNSRTPVRVILQSGLPFVPYGHSLTKFCSGTTDVGVRFFPVS